MTYVIAEPCIDVQDKACVGVCPVACINNDDGKDRKLYIDPDECIDCGALARCFIPHSRPIVYSRVQRRTLAEIRRRLQRRVLRTATKL